MFGQAKFSKSKYGKNMLMHESGNKIYTRPIYTRPSFRRKPIAADQNFNQVSMCYYV